MFTAVCAAADVSEEDWTTVDRVEDALLVGVFALVDVLTADDVGFIMVDVILLLLVVTRSLDDEDVELDDADKAPEDKYAAAMFGFEDRKPAARSPTGQPFPHGLDLQQPINGGLVYAQEYHLLPFGHS